METSQLFNKSKFAIRASASQRFIAACICLVIVGFFGVFAFAGHYNVNMGLWLGQCGFRQNTGLPCPSCGMTTATLAFAQGKIFQAFYIQPAAALFCLLLVFVALLAFIIAVFGVYFNFITRFYNEIKVRYFILAFLVIILAGWIVTLARALAVKS